MIICRSIPTGEIREDLKRRKKKKKITTEFSFPKIRERKFRRNLSSLKLGN